MIISDTQVVRNDQNQTKRSPKRNTRLTGEYCGHLSVQGLTNDSPVHHFRNCPSIRQISSMPVSTGYWQLLTQLLYQTPSYSAEYCIARSIPAKNAGDLRDVGHVFSDFSQHGHLYIGILNMIWSKKQI